MKKNIQPWIGLILLVIAHISLAITYASITPYRTPGIDISAGNAKIADIGAPDERAHANYIQWLLDGKGWPVLDLAKMKSDPAFRAEEYESHQPPLYYGFEAAVAKVAGVTDVADPTAKLPLRLPNALFGGATVVGVFCLCLWGFESRLAAFGAASIAALLPMSTALSGAISNDPLLIGLSTWVLAILALCVRQGWTTGRLIGLAVLTAAACWTKTTGLLLLPVILLGSLLPSSHKPKFKLVCIAFCGFLILSLPVWVHNQAHYGDPFAASAFNSAFSDTAQHSTISQVISSQGGNPAVDYWTKWVGWWTFRSFVGVFGYMDIWLNASGSPYISSHDPNLIYVGCLIVGLILGFGWSQAVKGCESREGKTIHWLLGLDFFLVLASFIAFNNHYFQAQGRYLYPAIGPISVALSLGAISLTKKKPALVIAGLVVGLCFLQFEAISTIPGQFEKRIELSQSSQNVYTVEAT